MSTPPPDGTYFRACPLCEAICGLAIEVEGGRIASIRGDGEDPFSRGHVCPKGVALADLHRDPDRLRRPQRRRGSAWREVGWDLALDEAAERIRAIREEHGRDAVAVYVGNPAVHNSGILLYGLPLLRTLRTRNRFSATSVDQLPHHLAAWQMYGHQLLLPVPDVDRTDFLLVLGANPVASNGSLMTAPGIRRRLQELRRRGGRLVVVDPRRSETAEMADRHLFVRPGSDALLLAALVHEILAAVREDLGRLAPFTESLGAVREAVADLDAGRAAGPTGVPAGEIRRLARELAGAESAVVYGRVGLSTQQFGGLCQWLIQVLNVITGNLDRPGGAMFTRPAVDLVARSSAGHRGRWSSRVRERPEFAGELPVATLAEEILAEGPGRIRALITVAGNPVLSTPNGRRLEEALGRLDFMVSIDPYRNETTRHAHLLLPPTGPLEHGHYDLVFNLLAVRDVARYSPPLFQPDPDARDDWEILAGLHRRLADGPLARLRLWVARRLRPRGLLRLALRFGPRGPGWKPFGRGVTLRRLLKAPHGLDLGPLEPCLPERLATPDHRIELAPPLFLDDLERLRAELPPAPPDTGDGLVLIGRRQLRSNNSWMHNAPRLMAGRPRCTLLMHPDDAAARGLTDGTTVILASRTGRIEAPLAVSDEMMPGVVSLPHGWGHDRPGVDLSVATASPGASINDVTDEERLDELAGTAAFSGVPVTVTAAG